MGDKNYEGIDWLEPDIAALHESGMFKSLGTMHCYLRQKYYNYINAEK